MKVEDMAALELFGRFVRAGGAGSRSDGSGIGRNGGAIRVGSLVTVRRRIVGGCNSRRSDHFFPADNARFVSLPLHLLGCGVCVLRIHVPRCTTVAHQILTTGKEGATGHVDVPKDVEWEAIVCDDHEEEGEVREEFEQVCSVSGRSRRGGSIP